MSKALAKLLDQPHTVVETALRNLEHWSGYESTDVRLLAEINSKVRDKTADLRLDPEDTTPQELYQALRARLAADKKRLDKRLGVGKNQSNDAFVERFVAFAQHADVHSETWALKWSSSRRLLRDHPPKRLMKQLNYRSVESMLKRESIGELYAALPFVESDRWLNVFWRDLASLGPAEFENRRIQVVLMSENRWKNAEKNSLETLPHIGVVAIFSGHDVKKLGVLGLGLKFFAAVSRLKAESSYLKLRQFEGGFGEQLLQVIKHELEPLHSFTSLKLDWQAVSQHLGKSGSDWLPSHLQHEDVHARSALDVMAELDPALRWWNGLEHVAQKYREPVSLNIGDILTDHTESRTFKHRSLEHLATSLWHELVGRYLQHDGVKSKLLPKLDSSQLQPETAEIGDFAWDESSEQKVGV